MNNNNLSKYLLLPIPKNPYNRIGPLRWQDYHHQLERTAQIALQLTHRGNNVDIAVISDFHPAGRSSEIDVYTKALREFAPGLRIRSYREQNDTAGQIERSFDLASKMDATPVFITTWMHYPRVCYLARGRWALHYGAFGIPHPAFFFIDPFCMIFQPIGDFLGISSFFRQIIIHNRERGRIL